MRPNSTVIQLPTVQSSEKLAARLATCSSPPLVLAFRGDIGTGKTTLIRALLRNLGVDGAIKSPTFSLLESYQMPNLQIHHFDLYRIHDETELDYIGFRDYFLTTALCCIEWPERAPSYHSVIDVDFTLDLKGGGRELQITSKSPAGTAVLACLAGG